MRRKTLILHIFGSFSSRKWVKSYNRQFSLTRWKSLYCKRVQCGPLKSEKNEDFWGNINSFAYFPK
jgi:hypothetical protein